MYHNQCNGNDCPQNASPCDTLAPRGRCLSGCQLDRAKKHNRKSIDHNRCLPRYTISIDSIVIITQMTISSSVDKGGGLVGLVTFDEFML